jgi:hypothetical protein
MKTGIARSFYSGNRPDGTLPPAPAVISAGTDWIKLPASDDHGVIRKRRFFLF